MAKTVGDLELAEHRQARFDQAAHERRVRVDAGAEHAKVEAGRRRNVLAQLNRDAALAQHIGALADAGVVRRVVPHGHPRAAILKKCRRFHAANSQSQHHDLFSIDVHKFASRVHLSFNVASAAIAPTRLMIQNRTTTVVSSQPLSSK